MDPPWNQGTPEFRKIKLSWEIPSFSTRYIGPGELLASTVFHTGRDYKDQWRLLMHPRGQSALDTGSVEVYLQLLHSEHSSHIKADVIFSIVPPGPNGSVIERKISDQVFVKRSRHGVREIMTFADIPMYLKGDTLRIDCEIWPARCKSPMNAVEDNHLTQSLQDDKSSEIHPGTEHLEEPVTMPPRLCDDLWTLFQNSKYADYIISVEDQCFFVHSFILQVRSPVFSSMFEEDYTMGTRSNEIVIEGIKPRVVKKMLQFMYTDRIDDYEEIAGDLLIAADIYALGGLRASCERVLCQQVNASNAVDLLILADSCNSTSLKSHVAKFINTNLPRIIKTEDYRKLEENYPELVFYLVRVMGLQMGDFD